MQSFSQKYTIVQLLEPLSEGATYSAADWPLHVSIAELFAIDWHKNSSWDELARLAGSQHLFTATAGDDELFGPNQDVRVTLLEKNDQLIKLHYDIVRLLRRAGATFNNPQYIEQGFRAHAAVRQHARLHKNDTVTFNSLTAIDMFPDADPYMRKVLKTYEFETA